MWIFNTTSKLLLLAVFLLASCETIYPPAPKKTRTSSRLLEKKALKAPKASLPKPRFIQEGIASWYGADLYKEQATEGEDYGAYELTAAHKSIPVNIYAKVTNLENNKSVVARINGRDPIANGGTISLSQTAANKIGLLESGAALVRIEALGLTKKVSGDRVFIVPADLEIKGDLTLRAGSFWIKKKADSLFKILAKDYPGVHIAELRRGNSTYYSVRVGKYNHPREAEKDLARLLEAGYKGTELLTE